MLWVHEEFQPDVCVTADESGTQISPGRHFSKESMLLMSLFTCSKCVLAQTCNCLSECLHVLLHVLTNVFVSVRPLRCFQVLWLSFCCATFGEKESWWCPSDSQKVGQNLSRPCQAWIFHQPPSRHFVAPGRDLSLTHQTTTTALS